MASPLTAASAVSAAGARLAGVAEEVVLIDAFEVPAGDAGAEFEFVNVARWRSAGDFAAATQSPGFRDAAAGLAGYRPHPALYRVVRS